MTTALNEAVIGIQGMAGAVMFSFGAYETGGDPTGLRRSLAALANAHAAATRLLDELEHQDAATVIPLRTADTTPPGPAPA